MVLGADASQAPILVRRARWVRARTALGDAVFDVDPKALRASLAAIQAWAEPRGDHVFVFGFGDRTLADRIEELAL